MMASLTTILGMIPLVNDDMFGSMAVTMMSGLLIGTLITLIMMPVLYAILYNVIHPASRKAKTQQIK
jgi:multidrug efflux pump subunit AcrB